MWCCRRSEAAVLAVRAARVAKRAAMLGDDALFPFGRVGNGATSRAAVRPPQIERGVAAEAGQRGRDTTRARHRQNTSAASRHPTCSNDPVTPSPTGRRWRTAPDEGAAAGNHAAMQRIDPHYTSIRTLSNDPMIPSPTGRRWRIAPDESTAAGNRAAMQHITPHHTSIRSLSHDPMTPSPTGRRWRVAPDEGTATGNHAAMQHIAPHQT